MKKIILQSKNNIKSYYYNKIEPYKSDIINNIIDFLKRNIIITIILMIGLFSLGFMSQFMKLIYSIIAIIGIDIILSNIAVIAFSKINFTKHTEDEEESKTIIAAKYNVLGMIYLGTSIAIGLSVFGMYYLYFVH